MTQHPSRLRFAPSPTGPIHVGNAHTMLFNWLHCRSQDATFVLRFEDTDRVRSRKEWEEVIVSEMHWLGLDWDEGPDIGGAFGPYYQTARMDLYQQYFAQLQQSGAVYPCYCTSEDLAAERKTADQERRAYQYSRRCLYLTPEERQQKERQGIQPAWRLRVPEHEQITYHDLLRGPITFESRTIGDPVIVRANGTPLYNFAVVVDDLSMQITDVVRGEGHIPNTPLQVLIYRQLGVEPPRFAHCSHLLNAERGKIAKRKGEMSVRSFRERGILGETLFNYLATLGWTPRGEGREILSQEEILREFKLEEVNRAAAVFDEEKLLWMNGVYLRHKTREAFADLALPFMVEAGMTTEANLRARWPWFVSIAALTQERVRLLEEVPPYLAFFFCDQLTYQEKAARKYLVPAMQPFLHRVGERLTQITWGPAAIEQEVGATLEAADLKRRDALLALRVAITGSEISPPLFESMALLGQHQVQSRLEVCLHAIETGTLLA